MAQAFPDFNTGTGLGPTGERLIEHIFVGVPLVLIVTWLTWIIYKAYRGWGSGKLSLFDVGSVTIQAFIVTVVMVVFLT